MTTHTQLPPRTGRAAQAESRRETPGQHGTAGQPAGGLVSLQHHRARPQDDRDGFETAQPLTLTHFTIGLLVCAAPLIAALTRPWWDRDPVLEQVQRDLAQVEQDKRELIRIYELERSRVMAAQAELKRLRGEK